MEDSPHTLRLTNDDFIAYHKHDGKKNYPGVVFLSGFMSDMSGIKATALHKFCQENDYSFVRFDYFGHGKSSKKFTECNIGIWKQNVLDVLDKLTTGKQILIGSSMGGWLMFLATLERQERIAGLIGIASAPDFTEDLIWEKMSLEEQQQLRTTGIFYLNSEFSDKPYPITLDLIEEGRNHLLLRTINNKLAEKKTEYHHSTNQSLTLSKISCPIRLIHGLQDTDVPSHFSTQLALQLSSHDVKIKLVEDGDHRMSSPDNIELLCNTLQNIMENSTR